MSLTNKAVHLNPGKLIIEGSFDLTSGAAVSTISNPDGSTKTVRGQHMSVAKNGTGTYDVTVKLASSLDGQPVFQPVEILYADANLYGTPLGGAFEARISAVAKDANGNIKVTVKTMSAAGADADTSAAITVCFKAEIDYARMDPVI